jgi:hypothetical protein
VNGDASGDAGGQGKTGLLSLRGTSPKTPPCACLDTEIGARLCQALGTHGDACPQGEMTEAGDLWAVWKQVQ